MAQGEGRKTKMVLTVWKSLSSSHFENIMVKGRTGCVSRLSVCDLQVPVNEAKLMSDRLKGLCGERRFLLMIHQLVGITCCEIYWCDVT